MQCVILAGGLATRMRPITEKIPKALIDVGGADGSVPFVDDQLRYLKQQGIDEVLFCVGYKGEMIEAHVGDGSRWGVKVMYSHEGSDLRGTGGALKLAAERGLLQDRFFVLYGDSFLPIAFQPVWDFFRKQGGQALMTVLQNGDQWDSSNVCYSNDRITLYDKTITPKPTDMRFIDYGLSILTRTLVEGLESGVKCDLADLFHRLSLDNQLLGYEVQQRFYEIGSMSGLEEYRQHRRKFIL